jgi:hypothetical protein
MGRAFEKAGRPGWEAIIPIYNLQVLTCEIARTEVIWFVLTFIPSINIVAPIIVQMELVKRFGKNKLFGMGLAFLNVISTRFLLSATRRTRAAVDATAITRITTSPMTGLANGSEPELVPPC